MNECYYSCRDDGAYIEEYDANIEKADEVLKCAECFSKINVGESYEKVEASWDGEQYIIWE